MVWLRVAYAPPRVMVRCNPRLCASLGGNALDGFPSGFMGLVFCSRELFFGARWIHSTAPICIKEVVVSPDLSVLDPNAEKKLLLVCFLFHNETTEGCFVVTKRYRIARDESKQA